MLSLVRSGPSTGAIQPIPTPPRGTRRNPLNEFAARIIAGDGHIDCMVTAEEAAQRHRIAQPGNRQARCLQLAQPVAIGLVGHDQKPGAALGGIFGREHAVYVAVARDDAGGAFIERIETGAARWRGYRLNSGLG